MPEVSLPPARLLKASLSGLCREHVRFPELLFLRTSVPVFLDRLSQAPLHAGLLTPLPLCLAALE